MTGLGFLTSAPFCNNCDAIAIKDEHLSAYYSRDVSFMRSNCVGAINKALVTYIVCYAIVVTVKCKFRDSVIST